VEPKRIWKNEIRAVKIDIIKATNELKEITCNLIKGFWKKHNHIDQTDKN